MPLFERLFPRFRIKGANLIGKVLQAPLLSTNFRSLEKDVLKDFGKSMFGKNLDASKIPNEFRTIAKKHSPDVFGKRFLDAVSPGVKDALQKHRDKFGLDTSKWDLTAKRTVYRTDQNPSSGHSDMVVSFEPLPKAEVWIQDYRLLRMFTGSFPGQFASLTKDMARKILSSGREIDGTPINAIQDNWGDILQYNAQLFRSREPLSGPQAVGWNSFTIADNHVIISRDGVDMQTSLMTTTARHSQDGIVPWTIIRHPDFPDGVVCISVHFGESSVPLGDMVNSGISAGLFKSIFRQGSLMATHYDDLVKRFGEDKAAGLMLDGEVAAHFQDIVWNEDWLVSVDVATLSALDATGGALMNFLRMFKPNTVATVDADDIARIGSQDDFSHLVDRGVEETKLKEGLGDGAHKILESGFVPPSATDVAPRLNDVIAGDDPADKDDDPYDKDGPPIGE